MMNSIQINGYNLSYITAGTGEPLLLLHGSLLDCRYWQPQVDAFSNTHRVIAPSLRHRWPDKIVSDVTTNTTEQHTNDAIAFIEALNFGPVHLLGHSYGGYIAAQLAQKRSDLLKSLILVEPGGPIQDTDAGTFTELAVITKNFAKAAALIEKNKTQEGVALFMDTVCHHPKWRDCSPQYQRITLDNAHSIGSQLLESRSPLPADGFSKLALPTLLMGGSLSPSPFPQTLNACHHLIQHSKLQQIDNASHLVSRDQPEIFNKIVLEFLQSIH